MPAANEAEAPAEAAMTRERKEGRTKRARARGGLAWPRRVELGGGPRRVERRAELRLGRERGTREMLCAEKWRFFMRLERERGRGSFLPFSFRAPAWNQFRARPCSPFRVSGINFAVQTPSAALWPVACGLWVGWGARGGRQSRHVHVMKFWTACTEWRSTHTMRYCYLQHSGASCIGALLLFK
jgi:hypothetical protein